MDGARGEGAQKVNYDLEKWLETIRDLQGDCLIFNRRHQYPAGLAMNEGMQAIPRRKGNPDNWGTNISMEILQLIYFQR